VFESLNQSPSRFIDKTVSNIARPGKKDTHQAPITKLRPSATIRPQAGFGGGIPAPRKLNDASITITCPTSKVARTIMVFTTLGNICRKSILEVEAPATRALKTKSCRRYPNVSPRTNRAYLADRLIDESTRGLVERLARS
jgi:hypothetical protein